MRVWFFLTMGELPRLSSSLSFSSLSLMALSFSALDLSRTSSRVPFATRT